MFNAETIIVGLAAGLIGIGVTLLLNIPIHIVENLTEITGISKLPAIAGIILVIISVVLTMIAGFIPSNMAAKKDPAIALRAESVLDICSNPGHVCDPAKNFLLSSF